MDDPVPSGLAPYDRLSTPTFATNADYRLVYVNARAEAFWNIRREDVTGRRATEALRLSPPDGGELRAWGDRVVFPALTMGEAFACTTVDGYGSRHPIQLSATRLQEGGRWYVVATVAREVVDGGPQPTPPLALRDSLTGLFNRHQWQREFEERDARAGLLIFFDLDGLKEINDLAGHARGDQALLTVGRALAAHTPAGALAVRFGGDEFLLVLQAQPLEQAEVLAAAVVAAASAAAAGLPLHLSHGIAAFEPGGLRAAVGQADEALSARKGVLLRGKGPGRILLTQAGRARVLRPGGDGEAPGGFSGGFDPEFDSYFRQMFARAGEQARDFVDFVAPQPGDAVVEIGAGSGRITFDGGLAERVGPEGQLLVTDPSAPPLAVARRRAHELGLHWLRFLQAPAEDLPLASDSADLVLGAAFLHFTDPRAAIASMARIARRGGRVALYAGMQTRWGPVCLRAVEPIRAALAGHGLPLRDMFLPRADLERLVAEAGLELLEVRQFEDAARFPSVQFALGVARQARIVSLLLRGVPAPEHAAVQAAVEEAFAQAFAEFGPEGATWDASCVLLSARRP